jgi:bifunctional pyridoxal-dependent enzyme with beta-cystathionase and maltose regulon repressor activities
MELIEKIELNKQIRAYNGTNSFIISLKKHLKSNKYLVREELGKRTFKVLSEKQYETFKSIVKFDETTNND